MKPDDIPSLREEILAGFTETLDQLLPWFVAQMPAAYFADTSEAERRVHLRAIAAARTSSQRLNITLRHEDGHRFTFLLDHDDPGLLADILAQVPKDVGLRQAKVHISADGKLAIDTVLLGEAPRFDPTDPEQARRAAAVVEEARVQEIDTEAVSRFLTRCSADWVRTVTPLRALRSFQRYAAVAGTEDTLVAIEPEVDPRLSRIVLAVGNATPRRMFERTAAYLGAHGCNILRAFVDVVEDPGNGFVTLLTYVLRGPDGPVTADGALWQRLQPDLERMKWITPAALTLSKDHKGLGLLRSEIAMALGSLAHQRLVRVNPFAFARERVVRVLDRYAPVVALVADYFRDRADPNLRLDDAVLERRRADVARAIDDGAETDDARRILHAMLDGAARTLKTNLFVPGRYGLALRLDPTLIERPELTDVPYGLFFVHGQGFDGFHLRFRDIARGGVRVVRPSTPQALSREIDRLYDEVYGLAHAQQLKNKDIPEGGAKAVIVSSPDVTVARAFKGFADGLLDLLVSSAAGFVVDRLGTTETLYLGPDENITPDLIEWVVARAAARGHRLAGAFMSSKPAAGINHKEYGVTSEGVNVCLDVALRTLGIDPQTQDFTVKLTGGPDGDVAGNMLRILHRDYGSHARVVGLADGSGCLEDPDGLDLPHLLTLVDQSFPVDRYDPTRLGPRGRLTPVSDPDGPRLRNSLHNRVVADVFVPAGGRPQTLNDSNWQEHLGPDGTPSSRVIVEGANLFLTPTARAELGARGVLVLKDSSANKCGVICSSFEIVAAHLWSDAEFLAHKPALVNDILVRLRSLARAEAELLFRERERTGTLLPELSVQLSRAMNRAADAIDAYLLAHPDLDPALLESVVQEHLPQTLRTSAGHRAVRRLPPAYARSIVAKSLAARIVYREGLAWVGALSDAHLGATAVRYLRAERASQALAQAVRSGEGFDTAHVAALIERAGPRAATETGD